jgi:hypothetical protein
MTGTGAPLVTQVDRLEKACTAVEAVTHVLLQVFDGKDNPYSVKDDGYQIERCIKATYDGKRSLEHWAKNKF